jgi:Ricin-type beta-trefoil lectin domain-like
MTGITSLITEPAVTGSQSQVVSSRRSQVRRRLARIITAAACLAGSAGALLATAAIASATVDNTQPAYRQPAGIVYSLVKNNNVNNSNLLTVDGGAMNDGALVNTWTRTIEDTQAGGNITQANQLWEFIPQADNSGGRLTTGFGELRNRQSGLCLDIHGQNTQDAATVDQWDCVPGAKNEEWKATFQSAGVAAGSWVVASEMDGAYLGTDTPGCTAGSADGNGDAMYARTQMSSCTLWAPRLDSYRFATNKVTEGVYSGAHIDDTNYGCVPGYKLRVSSYLGKYEYDSGPDGDEEGGLGQPTWFWAYSNLSDSGINVNGVLTQGSPSNPPNQLTGGYLNYTNPTTTQQSGQIMLYCDPQSTTP